MPNYAKGSRAKCIHCHTVVLFEDPDYGQSREGQGGIIHRFNADKKMIHLYSGLCPNCSNVIFSIQEYITTAEGNSGPKLEQVIWPLSSGRQSPGPEVPGNIAQDYNEAALVLPFSAKASAALSRRCLQAILRDAGKTTKKDLNDQIVEILPKLPTYIAQNLDAVRHIGNFAAHEQKSTVTGAIMDVEPGEAEWNLDVLDALFDFYYIKPEIEKRKRDELNKKLIEAGKPPLKI